MVVKKNRILVTGASSDIGAAIVRFLSEQEYTMAIGLHYNGGKTVVETLKKEVMAKVDVELFQSNFESGSGDLIERFLDRFGSIDVLINCAGLVEHKAFEDILESEYDKTMDVNGKTPFFITQKAFVRMKENGGGKVINISTNATKFGRGGGSLIHYAASKAVLDTLTEALSRIGAEHNILVNSIRPGVIETDFNSDRKDLEFRKSIIPLGRFGSPDDIASMVGLLISERGDFITGQIIKIAGGE